MISTYITCTLIDLCMCVCNGIQQENVFLVTVGVMSFFVYVFIINYYLLLLLSLLLLLLLSNYHCLLFNVINLFNNLL